MDFDDELENITDIGKVKDLIRDLRLHVIELEMQNWELLKASNEIEKNKNFFLDFYENAPVGHVQINIKGCIRSINLKFASLFNLEKVDIEKTNIYSLLKDENETDKLHIHIHKLIDTNETQVFDLILKSSTIGSPKQLVTATLKQSAKSDVDEISLCMMSYQKE